MVTVKTWCSVCGEQELPSDAISLVTYRPVESGRDFYRFRCPDCGEDITRPADKWIIKALRAGKVPETSINLPDEVLDSKRQWTKPLTSDDMLDFALQLANIHTLADCK